MGPDRQTCRLPKWFIVLHFAAKNEDKLSTRQRQKYKQTQRQRYKETSKPVDSQRLIAKQTHRLKEIPKRRQTNIHTKVIRGKKGKITIPQNVTNNSLKCKDKIQAKHYKVKDVTNPVANVLCIIKFPVKIQSFELASPNVKTTYKAKLLS